MAINSKISLYLVISSQVMKPELFVARATSIKLSKYFAYTITFRQKDIAAKLQYKLLLLRTLVVTGTQSHGLEVFHIEKVLLLLSSWRRKAAVDVKTFLHPTWGIGAENRSVECLLIFIIVIVVVVVIVMVILLLMLSSTMILIIGFTCPPIIHFKFIILSATAYYYTVRWSVITNCYIFLSKKCDNLIKKVRQVLQSSTIITRCYRTHRAKSKKRKQQLDDNRFTIMTPDSVFDAPRDKFPPRWTIPESLKK